jgi:hypothetical protein
VIVESVPAAASGGSGSDGFQLSYPNLVIMIMIRNLDWLRSTYVSPFGDTDTDIDDAEQISQPR